jgi:hypothetical protein
MGATPATQSQRDPVNGAVMLQDASGRPTPQLEPLREEATSEPLSKLSAEQVKAQPGQHIYFHRRTLAYTVLGRPLDIITISDFYGWHEGCDEGVLPGEPSPTLYAA